MKILVTGAGGFIGGHLVKRLLAEGHEVMATDVKPDDEWYQCPDKAIVYDEVDLRDPGSCADVCWEQDQVFNLAADMGGMGFIETHKADCMLSVLISTNMLVAARDAGVERFFYSSSACVYRQDRQTEGAALMMHDIGRGLKEWEAYPADPEDGYGWEKLFSERMCRHFTEDFGLQTRVARYHNVYGPHGAYDGGREKAPAAICRKVAQAKVSGDHEIEVWGGGDQMRSFTYIDDAIDGTLRLMDSDVTEPLNVGSSQMVTINDLVDLVAKTAGVTLYRTTHDLSAPQGVRGRNSDNTAIRKHLGWEPSVRLEDGIAKTYYWILDQVARVSDVATTG